MTLLEQINHELQQLGNEEKRKVLQGFFKTGPGQYGEGDVFLGINVPVLRKLAKKYRDLCLQDATELLTSEIHEARLLALFIMIHKFEKGDEKTKSSVYEIYLSHTNYVNNWDLVDLSAYQVVGCFLFEKDRSILAKLAVSDMLWERRIAIVATYYFIKNNDFDETLKIAEILLHDKHDLIHKAVGWMLREVGKRELAVEEGFLKGCYTTMPRTMLRYAIERFPEEKRQAYLKGLV
jgi:3-methyladenine DNA glycosylase AlkD